MFCGLFWSRALLSITLGGWFLFAIVQHMQWLPFFKKDSLLLWSFCPLLLFWLGVWQQPSATANYDYLLTLAVYPVAALAIRSCKHWGLQKEGKVIWLWASAIGLLYPVGWFLFHISGSIKAYGMGQSLPTFMDADHVRFGIFLCAAYLFSLQKLIQRPMLKNWVTGLLFLSILFMAVRTAWVILLLISVYFIVLPSAKHIQTKHNRFLLPGMLLLLAVSFFIFPTIKQKIAYTVYDWQQFKPGQYDASFSDGTRRAINAAAWQSVNHEEGANTGWAAIPETLAHFFSVNNPGADLHYGWPFNQYLFWWMGSGWWGMLLFTCWLLFPIGFGWKRKNHGLVCWSLAIALSCLVESTINYQYGAWLHVWPLVLMWDDTQSTHPESLQQTVVPEIKRADAG